MKLSVFLCVNVCVAIDRTLEEQLAEMTALVLKLPEVDCLLQRAGLRTDAAMQEPKAALTLFVKVQTCTQTLTHTLIITLILFITVSFFEVHF